MHAPYFSLRDQDGKTVTLSDFKGKKLLLYFYPKADTPGCTIEACGLRDNMKALKTAGVAVVGVSPDEPADLKAFAEKHSLPFTLLADPSTTTLQAYGVWGEKQFMGHKYMGVLRTTVLIDERGEIVKRFDNVKPETHADMLLAEIRGMQIGVARPVRVIPMKEPSRKSPTKAVDQKVLKKGARKIVSNPVTIKKLAIKKKK